MTYEELIAKVALIIQDGSFTDSDIGGYINQAQHEIAGGMQSALGDWITPPLPQLFTIDTVTTVTDAAYVSMPVTFHRSLQFAAASGGYEIDIAPSFLSFSETYPLLDQSGRISEVVEFGGNFYYQGIPTTAEDVTLHFYRLPVDMEDDDDTPDGIPLHLQSSLLVNHAAWKIFDLIEDDFSEPGINTQRYQASFYTALKILELTIPYENRRMNLI
jgi:hypothetical protein